MAASGAPAKRQERAKSLPMMPVYVRDYIAATRSLSIAERGAYIDLLFAEWDLGGPLPTNPARLAAIIGCTPKQFAPLWKGIRHKFVRAQGGWINSRLEAERANALAKREKAADKASAASVARWQRAPGNAPSNAPSIGQALLEQCPPSPSPSPSEELRHPLPPRRGGGNGAKAPREKSPERRSLAAWKSAIAAIDAVNGTDRTWADVAETLADRLADQAIDAAGGHRLIADRTQFNASKLEERFRSAYELQLRARDATA